MQASGKLDMAWIERTMREASMRDLAKMLEGFLNNEIPQILGKPATLPGEEFHSFRERTVCTIAGQITLRRAYYTGPRGGRYPMDGLLKLHDSYTPAVVQLMCWSGAMDSSFDLASQTLQRFAGLNIPGRQVQRVVNAKAMGATEWMRARPADVLPAPVDILNIQVDMTGIPMRPEELDGIKGKQPDGSAKTRQIKMGCIFTQKKTRKGKPVRDPFSNTYVSAFCDVTDFGSLMYEEALKRGYGSAARTVFLGDGAEWIWNLAESRFKDAVQIVDFFHACEHLNDLCKLLEPQEQSAQALFIAWRKILKCNGLNRILDEVAQRALAMDASVRQEIQDALGYFHKNTHRMTYRTFRRKGYFIGSGAVEGACRHIVAQRTKLSGMRWLCSGAENVLAFRSLIKSNLFDSFAKQPLAA